MNVADKFSDKNEIISFLKPTALYMLSAPSTPESVREEVTAKIENGEDVTIKEIQNQHDVRFQYFVGVYLTLLKRILYNR